MREIFGCKAKIPIKGIESLLRMLRQNPLNIRCKAKIPIKGIERENTMEGWSEGAINDAKQKSQ